MFLLEIKNLFVGNNHDDSIIMVFVIKYKIFFKRPINYLKILLVYLNKLITLIVLLKTQATKL